MKAKYLFYSFALASAFTACTQDEIVDAPVLNDASAERPVVGVVTFANGDVDSRYNSEAAKFENGDKMGLYLMDEFRGWGEMDDANDTYWNWQSSWWDMYNMVDYISTNYGYVYNAETGEWINRASQLIEGNYIAMFPQNTRATNRRDLWHPINANVDLVDHSSTPRYYVNRENQFFVGYEQIMRDQKAGEETGELTADISMKPILTYAKFKFVNESNFNFKIKKVVFKASGGATLPNVAYVKPAGIVFSDNDGCVAPWWAWSNHAALKETLPGDCDAILARGKYDRSTYTQAAARSMVKYASTADGHIPYGMTDVEAVPTYEYVFNFPVDADILYGGIEATSVDQTSCAISIALPAFEGWKNMEVVVYGEMQDDSGIYRPGILRKRDDVDNGKFTLNQLKEWEMGKAIPMSTVNFDHNYFYQQEELRVSTTEDLINLLTARLSDVDTSDEVIPFIVQHYGNGLEITKEVVDLIKAYEADNNTDITVKFNNLDRVSTPVIFKTDAIDMFEYNGVNVVVETPQTITQKVNGLLELRNFSTITVAGVKDIYDATLTAVEIVNEVDATISTSYADVNADIHNEGTVDLSATTVYGNILNEAVMNAGNGSDVNGTITNDNDCLNCGDDKATLTINGLEVDYLINADNVVVNGKLTIVSNFTNNGSTVNNGEINGDGQIDNYSVIDNYGKITIKGILFNHAAGKINNGNIEADKAGVITDGLVKNGGEINAYKGTIKPLLNLVQESDGEKLNGVLRVWAAEGNEVQSEIGSCGTIIFEDVNAQHIGTDGQDLRVYRTAEDRLASELKVSMNYTGASQIWTAYDIHFDDELADCGTSYAYKLNRIVVTGSDVTFTANVEDNVYVTRKGYNLTILTLEIAKKALLNIEDNSKFAAKEVVNNGEIHIASGSFLYTGTNWGNIPSNKLYSDGHQVE